MIKSPEGNREYVGPVRIGPGWKRSPRRVDQPALPTPVVPQVEVTPDAAPETGESTEVPSKDSLTANADTLSAAFLSKG